MDKFKVFNGVLVESGELGQYEPFFVSRIDCSRDGKYCVDLWYPRKESKTFEIVHVNALCAMRSAILYEKAIGVLLE